METSEVICAVSTAPGIGAIAVLRMSGTGCIALTDRIFESPSGKKLTGAKANTVHFGRILEEGCLLDEVLVTIFHAPFIHRGGVCRNRLSWLLVYPTAFIAAVGESGGPAGYSRRIYATGFPERKNGFVAGRSGCRLDRLFFGCIASDGSEANERWLFS